jgi:1,4-dihydroxy-2-naphthoate octaprenyltransferase
MDWEKYFSFDSLITPTIIKIVYAVGSLGWILFALYGATKVPLSYLSLGDILWGILFFFLVLLAIRVYCEILVVMFKISDNTSKLANKD